MLTRTLLTEQQGKAFRIVLDVCHVRAYFDKHNPRGRDALGHLDQVLRDHNVHEILNDAEYEELYELLEEALEEG